MTAVQQLHRVRALSSDDTELLERIDQAYAGSFGLEVTASRGSTSFHARTGHSFVAELDGHPVGFVLATALWSGGRPLVRLERLATVEAADGEARTALLEALIKSAYDAGVYDLLADVPEADEPGHEALLKSGFALQPLRTYGLVLGSRGHRRAGR